MLIDIILLLDIDKSFLYNIQALKKRRCSSMVEHYLAKVDTRVRFPSPAPVQNNARLNRAFLLAKFILIEI